MHRTKKATRIQVSYLVDAHGLDDARYDPSTEATVGRLTVAFVAPAKPVQLKVARADARSAAVRPYPACSADVQAVAELSAHLVQDAKGRGVRLDADEVRVPILVMTQLVWQAIHQAPLRLGRKNIYFREDALELVLDAMKLGPHRVTAERVLRRDHPRHIAIDVSVLESGHAEAEWNGHLGILAVDDTGKLRPSSSSDEHPRILRSLVAPEPF